MKNPWGVLGLERGADRAEVRRAYARRLKQTNPEDDPQGFMALREAYEWLLDHLEYESADFDDYRADELPVHAPDMAEPAVAMEGPVNPWAAVQEADPDEASLDRLVAQLEEQLAGASDAGRGQCRELMAAILGQLALAKLEVAARVEYQLAHVILEHLPASDSIILQAVDAFNWTDQRRAHEFPFSGVIARLDEWRLIQSLERPDDQLHLAWRLLTNRTSAGRRWWQSRTERREQVAELLEYADYSAPGLIYSMDSESVAWWRAELQHERVPVEPVLWRAAGGLLLAFTLPNFGLGPLASILVAGTVVAALIGDLLAARHFMARWPWRQRPFWQIAVPILAFLAVPPLLLLIPLSWPVAVATILLAIGLVWAARYLLRDPTGVPRERRWATALGLGALLLLASTTDDPVPLAQFAVLAAVSWLLILNLPLLRPVAAAVADRLTRDWSWPLMAAYGIGVLLFAWDNIGAPGQVPLVRLGIAAMACLAAGGIAVFATRPIPPFILGLMLIFANGSVVLAQAAMLDETMFNSATAGEAIASLRSHDAGDPLELPQRQAIEAMRTMESRNPRFHARLQAIAEEAGELGTGQVAAAERIDAAIRREVTRLLPLSSNKLIAEHERLRSDIVTFWRKRDVGVCADQPYAVDERTDDDIRSRTRQAMLAVVAHGPAQPSDRRDAPLPGPGDYEAAKARFKREAEAWQVPVGSTPQALGECNELVASMRAVARLGDAQLGTIRRMGQRN